MPSMNRIIGCLLVLLSLSRVSIVEANKVLSPAQRYARKVNQRRSLYRERQLQEKNDKDDQDDKDEDDKDDNDKNGKDDEDDEDEEDEDEKVDDDEDDKDDEDKLEKEDEDEDEEDEEDEVQQPRPAPTTAPITARPTFPPTPPPVTSSNQQQQQQQQQQGQGGEDPDNIWTTPGQTFSTSNNNQITLSMDELRDIQYFGGGEITLRFSLWFQDQTAASQVGAGPTLLAVLHSLQEIMCRSDGDLTNPIDSDPLGLSTLDWADASQVEERELCVVPLELGGAEMRSSSGTQVEGSILLQPPTTYVVDRTASNTDLHWTTWRVSWDVLRLGTFYILQGLENAGGDSATLQEEEIYRAGISAMQGILELALEVSIRETTFDQVLVGSMVQTAQSEGMVLASVYGEEVETLEPKLEWLGLAQPSSNSQNTNQDDLVVPTSVTSAQGQAVETSATASDAESVEDVDYEWDDDQGRYSKKYGISEPLDPEFWHPLRIVGIVMFFLTSLLLVSLSCMSKRRQKRRAMERKTAKEGLLNNPQGVEDMLRASHRDNETKRGAADTSTTSPRKSHSNTEEEEEEESKQLNIPMPSNLKVT